MAEANVPPPANPALDHDDDKECIILMPTDHGDVPILVAEPDICHEYNTNGRDFCHLSASFRDSWDPLCPSSSTPSPPSPNTDIPTDLAFLIPIGDSSPSPSPFPSPSPDTSSSSSIASDPNPNSDPIIPGGTTFTPGTTFSPGETDTTADVALPTKTHDPSNTDHDLYFSIVAGVFGVGLILMCVIGTLICCDWRRGVRRRAQERVSARAREWWA